MKTIIIGGSGAGITCADTLRKHDAEMEITVVGKENILPYYRVQLSHMLCKEEVGQGFYLKDRKYYEEKNIDLLIGREVININKFNKEITLDDGTTQKYDKLVFAVGSNNFVPPIEGIQNRGVFNLRNFSDLININTHMKDKQKVVIIGGGLLGIEAAWAFRNAGKDVTILEFAPRLMARQLSEKASELVEAEIRRCGIKVFTGKSTNSIIGNGVVEKLELVSGEIIEADAVLFSIGIRPELKLAKDVELKIDKSIVVNEKMETSEKDIFAIGDCVEVNGLCLGIWPLAVQTGKIAAMSILGKEESFVVNPPMVILKALEIGVYSAGDIYLNDNQIELGDSNNYKLFTFKDNRLTGVNLIGDTKLSTKVMSMLSQGLSKEEVLEKIK